MNVSTAFTITRGNRRDSYDVVILLEVEQRGIEYREYHPIYIKRGVTIETACRIAMNQDSLKGLPKSEGRTAHQKRVIWLENTNGDVLVSWDASTGWEFLDHDMTEEERRKFLTLLPDEAIRDLQEQWK